MSTSQVYNVTGIVLLRRSVGEADRIIVLFTRHFGKKRVIAKGIRKTASRRASHLELFTKVNLVLHKGKILDTVTEASSVIAYGASLTNLTQVAAAYAGVEAVNVLLPEGQTHDDVYELLDNFLSALRSPEGLSKGDRLIFFIDALLVILGYRNPETKSINLNNALSSVERIIERKLKSTKLLMKSSMM